MEEHLNETELEARHASRARDGESEFQPHSLASSSADSVPVDKLCSGSTPSLEFAGQPGFQLARMNGSGYQTRHEGNP